MEVSPRYDWAAERYTESGVKASAAYDSSMFSGALADTVATERATDARGQCDRPATTA